ncbi:VOC family protein [Sphingomonas sp. LaA6.9]|uniref:VOC family protein n=1 Tax=Sphingomonas sp. LaA6.9 TaxID=2919914 RepID=UPI001F4F19A3|nr:VOC family protein [Sphingomonas sp. LaA6.9]MCJ8159793.1 VOC family protein [Sphingomonas sp. LaA6.9]
MITGRHYQNAYVTRNVDKAVASFKQFADIRALMEIEVPVQLWTPQGEGTGVQKLAFVWVEDLNFELIEPKEGEALAIYRDALPADDSLKFHHVCHVVDDWDELMGKVAKQPFPIVLKGGTPGMLQFLYLDAREWLGHYIEYVWMVPERWAAMGGR